MPTYPNTNMPDLILQYEQLAMMMLKVYDEITWTKLLFKQSEDVSNPSMKGGKMQFTIPKEIEDLIDVTPTMNWGAIGDPTGNSMKFLELTLDYWKKTNPARTGYTSKDMVTHDVKKVDDYFMRHAPSDIANAVDSAIQTYIKNHSYRVYGDVTKNIFDSAAPTSHSGVFSSLFTGLVKARAGRTGNYFVINPNELSTLTADIKLYSGSGVQNNLAQTLPANVINGLNLVENLVDNYHTAGNADNLEVGVEIPLAYPDREQVITLAGDAGDVLVEGDIIWFGSDTANTHVVRVGNTWSGVASKTVTISPGVRDVIPVGTIINCMPSHSYNFAINTNAIGIGAAALQPTNNELLRHVTMNMAQLGIPITYSRGLGYHMMFQELSVLYGLIALMPQFIIRVVSKQQTANIPY